MIQNFHFHPFPDDISETCAAAKDVAVCSHGTTMTRQGCGNAEFKQQGVMFCSVCCGIACSPWEAEFWLCQRTGGQHRDPTAEMLLCYCHAAPSAEQVKKSVFRHISKIFVHTHAYGVRTWGTMDGAPWGTNGP